VIAPESNGTVRFEEPSSGLFYFVAITGRALRRIRPLYFVNLLRNKHVQLFNWTVENLDQIFITYNPPQSMFISIILSSK